MMNSSNEMVKQISRLEMTPGATSGRVTRRKVPSAVSPRSSEASSRVRSKPWKRGDQHRDREGHADQDMAERDGEQRQLEAELQQQHEQRRCRR